jgi:hypothetical protein
MFCLLLCAALAVDDQNKDAKKDQPPPDRIVVWNSHNGPAANTGTTKINVFLLAKGATKPVWEKKDVVIPWSGTEDKFVMLPYDVKKKKFQRIRVEVAAFHLNGGGLAEIQVFQGGKNISEGCLATVSAVCKPNDPRDAKTLTDGITTSKEELVGYWHLPGGKTGWAEVDLTKTADGKTKKK